MKFCISFGMISKKLLYYYASFSLAEIYCNSIINIGEGINEILCNHELFDSLCFFLGYLLNIIPALISRNNSKSKENLKINEFKGENIQSIKYIYNKANNLYLSRKDIIILLFLCFFFNFNKLN
jgi:hypothetical protein